MNNAHQQMQSIQAMLVLGYRSVKLEKHSLILLGLIGGFITGFTEYIITNERFPNTTQRAIALLFWLSFWLLGMAVVDHQLSRHARQLRDETLPFAQAQITRAWWMLLSMGVLGSFAMFFYGGVAMIYALWIVLLGLGVYLFGLFSQPLVEWIGLATILLGVTGLAAGLPYGVTHWLAASCFAIGMPLAGWLNQRYGNATLPARMLALLFWITLVTTPPLLSTQFSTTQAPTMHPIALDSGNLSSGEQVLRLEAGTPVALRLDLEGTVLEASPSASLNMRLSMPVEVGLLDGKPDGRYRLGNSQWHAIHDGVIELAIDKLMPQLEQGQPVVRAHAVFSTHFNKETRP